MNKKLILRALSIVVFVVCITFIVSLCAQLYIFHDSNVIYKWEACIMLSFFIGIFLFFTSRGCKKNIFKREVLAIIGLGWLTVIAIGMIPYLILLDGCSLSDAFFESASGFTTTGTSAFKDLEIFPESLVFFRSISQWIGGIGTIFFFSILLPVFGERSKSICVSGLSISHKETSFTTTKTIIKFVLGIYATLTLIGIFIFRVGGMSILDAICYSFSVASTGGFSTSSGHKILENSDFLQYFSVLAMGISGMNFIACIRLITRSDESFEKHEELSWYFRILIFATVFVTITMAVFPNSLSFSENFRYSLFHVTSLMTTTGLKIYDFLDFPVIIKVVFFILMLCGGCAGSTTGGLKVSRLIIACKMCAKSIIRSFRPQVITPIFFNKNRLYQSDEDEIMSYILSVCAVFTVAMILLSVAVPNGSFFGILSSVFSIFFNIGMESSDARLFPAFCDVGHMAKYIYGSLMLIGRVEVYAIAALFFPTFWKKFM